MHDDDAVANVKAWVSDPTKSASLHDLLHAEATAVIQRMQAEEFAPKTTYTDEELVRRVSAYEAMMAHLARAMALGGYWGHAATRPLWPSLIQRLANTLDRTSGAEVWLDLYLYPALLALYSGGIAAVAARRYDSVATMLMDAAVFAPDSWQPAVLALYPDSVLEDRFAQRLPHFKRRYTAFSDKLAGVVRPWLGDLVPIDADWDRQFDRFEYLSALIHYDLRRSEGGPWAPVGRFSWRNRRGGSVHEELWGTDASRLRSSLLEQNLFGGSAEQYAASVQEFVAHLTKIRSGRF